MTDAPDARPVLELRIHGVNNTSPASMLDRPECQLSQVDGDKLGSFWQVSTSALDARVRGDHGYVPDGVTREAYSWGGMARSGLSTGTNAVAATVARIGWALLLPFGLANLAYWSRSIPSADASPTAWWTGRGAGGVRAFGLGLTVLLISAVSELALDVFAVQCYPLVAQQTDLTKRPLQCVVGLPSWIDVLADTGTATRLAYASLLPLLVLLGLWWLTSRSRLRYEAVTPSGPPPPEAAGQPVLARPDLWRGGEMVRGLTQLHVAAGFAVIVIASAWPAVFGASGGCRTPEGFLTSWASCAKQAAPVFRFVLVAALAVLLASIVLVCLRAHDNPDLPGRSERWVVATTPVLLGGAVLLTAAHLLLLVTVHPAIATEVGTRPVPLPGVNAAPVLVMAVLVGIATSALAWRGPRKWAGLTAILVTVGLLLVCVAPWWGVGVALAGVLTLLVLSGRSDQPEATAWGGRAPGVLLGLSLLTALTLSTVLVVGASGVLNGSASAAALISCPDDLFAGSAPISTTKTVTATTTTVTTVTPVNAKPPQLCVAPIYIWFGSATVITLVALLAVLLIVVFLRRPPLLPSPSAGPSGDLQGDAAAQVLRAQTWAAMAHRAERFTGVIAALGLMAALISVAGALVPPDSWAGLPSLVSVGTLLAHSAVIATAAAALGIVASFGRGGPRPLGLAWDLMCFLPRAAHPFSPPCYAERAVPELSGRVRRWLATPGHHVVLSAHSLGAVLAVAVIYRLDAESRTRLQLITYGVQLRAYFGRIFPDLLGPKVLGTPACRAATLFGRDPWAREIAWKRPTEEPGQDTLRNRLPNSWINLWRRTDYLGFPAAGYQDHNDLDSPAEEWVGKYDAAVVGTHGNYPRTDSYRDALDRTIEATQRSLCATNGVAKTPTMTGETDANSETVGAAVNTNAGAVDAGHAPTKTDRGIESDARGDIPPNGET